MERLERRREGGREREREEGCGAGMDRQTEIERQGESIVVLSLPMYCVFLWHIVLCELK